MTRKRPIAVAQTIPVRGDVDANVEQHLQLARAASDRGVQLLVYPELSLTGYELDLAPGLVFSEDDRRLDPLVEAASSLSMTLVVGAPVRLAERQHIGAFIVDPDRGIDLYTKHRLGAFSSDDGPNGSVPPAESTVFVPGERNPLVRMGDDRAALAVCADVGRASHAESAARRGAMAYLAGMFIIPPDLERETTTLRSVAARHAMLVGLANFGGPSGGLDAAGRSAIWSPTGERLVRLEATGAGVALATEIDGRWRGEAFR